MNTFCPNCEKDTEQHLIYKDEEIDIRGELIPVQLELHHCKECGEDYEKPSPE